MAITRWQHGIPTLLIAPIVKSDHLVLHTYQVSNEMAAELGMDLQLCYFCPNIVKHSIREIVGAQLEPQILESHWLRTVTPPPLPVPRTIFITQLSMKPKQEGKV